MNRTTIRSRVREYIDRSDIDHKIEAWINDTRRDIALKYNFRYLYVEATASTTAGTSKYALPTDYLGHLVVWLGSKKLMRVSSREFDELTLTDVDAGASPRMLSLEGGSSVTTTSIAGAPDYYVERGMEIELYPTPNAVYTIRLKYYAQPVEYDVDTSTDSTAGDAHDSSEDYIMRFHADAVIWGTALRAAIYLDDDKKMATFSAAFKSAIEEMVAREKENLTEDTHPRMKDYKDYDLTTFKRMTRVNLPGGTISKFEADTI